MEAITIIIIMHLGRPRRTLKATPAANDTTERNKGELLLIYAYQTKNINEDAAGNKRENEGQKVAYL